MASVLFGTGFNCLITFFRLRLTNLKSHAPLLDFKFDQFN